MKKNSLPNDGERMVPEQHKDNLFYVEHMTRYTQCEPIVKDKIVLDIACGSGYGTKIISNYAKNVIGVDINERAINYAKTHYSANNIEYILGDGEKIPLEDSSIDVVTTFETIEHVPDYEKFISEIKRVLRPDGISIISTPNDLEYGEGNHFHIYEFQYQELLRLLKKRFKYVDSYFQSTWKSVLLDKLDGHISSKKRAINVQNYSPLVDSDKAIYFYLVCSNKPIDTDIEPIIGLGPHLSEATEWETQKSNNLYVDELKKSNEKLIEDFNNIERKLDEITTSKAYKFAQKLQIAKKKTLGRARSTLGV